MVRKLRINESNFEDRINSTNPAIDSSASAGKLSTYATYTVKDASDKLHKLMQLEGELSYGYMRGTVNRTTMNYFIKGMDDLTKRLADIISITNKLIKTGEKELNK